MSAAEPLFHIAGSAAWRAAESAGVYRGDSLEREGFIHCSTRAQVLEVADRLFRGRIDLVLLEIDPARLAAPVRFENLEGGRALYPHVYGPIEVAAVQAARPFTPGGDGRFSWPR